MVFNRVKEIFLRKVNNKNMALSSNPPPPAPSPTEIKHIKQKRVYELVLAAVRAVRPD